MLLTGRAGHTKKCPGASALIDEVIESRRIFKRVVELLREGGNKFISCQPKESISEEGTELKEGIRKANESNAELGFSIHFNKAYESYEGKLGSECWVYSGQPSKSYDAAKNICKNLSELGFVGYKSKPRGVKVNPALYEIRNSVMPWIIIEVCFVEAERDVQLYNHLGIERVARAIANGIDSRVLLDVENNVESKKEQGWRVVTGYYEDYNNAKNRVTELKEKGIDSYLVHYEK